MKLSSLFVVAAILQLSATTSAAAPPHSPQTIALPVAPDTSGPYNLTSPRPINSLPADPARFHIPASTQSISFGRYSRTLPPHDVLSCLLQAANLVIKQLKADSDRLIDTDEIQTSSGVAHLILKPSEKMTWGMFGTTVQGMTDFVMNWEYVDFDFEVMELGYKGIVGYGALAYI